MSKAKTFQKRKMLILTLACILGLIGLAGRLTYIMIFRSEYYLGKAQSLHERERSIKAPRGLIYDRNGVIIAGNQAVCSISVIHSQITDEEEVVAVLSQELGIDSTEIRTKVEKVSVREKIKSNVDKTIADAIRAYNLDGVMIDEDYKRYYPFGSLASKVIGFTGADNQGIVGLEVQYNKYLQGQEGSILTVTDAYGIELQNVAETRAEPVAGQNLYLTLDMNIQTYAQQAADNALIAKQANRVSVIVMNPQNGGIFALMILMSRALRLKLLQQRRRLKKAFYP